MAEFANGGVLSGPKIRHFRGLTVLRICLYCIDLVPLQNTVLLSKTIIYPIHHCYAILFKLR